jgi:hypothetical protein
LTDPRRFRRFTNTVKRAGGVAPPALKLSHS